MKSQDGPQYRVDDEFISDAANITEALVNLNYLICLECDDPRMVRLYANQADERLHALGRLLHSIRTA